MSSAAPGMGSARSSGAPQLDEAYERLHAWGPEWGGDEEGNNGLTNHGPMAAEVLARRGFGDLVPRWVESYLPRREPLPTAADRITRANWRGALGDGRRVGDWTAYLGDGLAHRPWRATTPAPRQTRRHQRCHTQEPPSHSATTPGL